MRWYCVVPLCFLMAGHWALLLQSTSDGHLLTQTDCSQSHRYIYDYRQVAPWCRLLYIEHNRAWTGSNFHLLNLLRLHRACLMHIQTDRPNTRLQTVPTRQLSLSRWTHLLHYRVCNFSPRIYLSLRRLTLFSSFLVNVPAAVVASLQLNPLMDIMFTLPASIVSVVCTFLMATYVSE